MVGVKRLLLVEDDAVAREVLLLLLAGEGWDVDAVETGEQAIGRLREPGGMPDVVLCDLHLPGICGAPLAAAMHEMAPGTCLIAMSATPGSRVAGYAAGLLKPFPPAAVQLEWEQFVVAGGDVAASSVEDADASATARVAGGPDEEAAEEADSLPVLKQSTLLQLQTQMGAAGAQGFYAFALADMGDRLHRMQKAVDTGDAESFVREAHAVKGSCGMMGALRLWELASVAESDGLSVASGEKVSRMVAETQALRLMLEIQFPLQQQMP